MSSVSLIRQQEQINKNYPGSLRLLITKSHWYEH